MCALPVAFDHYPVPASVVPASCLFPCSEMAFARGPIAAVQALFSHFDLDGSGKLELAELKPFLKALQVRRSPPPNA